jgi:hypothetical protein
MRSALIILFPCALVMAQGAQPSKAPVGASPAVPATPLPEEELLTIKKTPYQPTLERDPFRAPSDMEMSKQGDLVDDIGVKGRVVSNGNVFAVVSDSRGNIRNLPVGYKFRDGEIVSIDEKSVTFRQWDVNSTNRSVAKKVVKPFKREEGKR